MANCDDFERELVEILADKATPSTALKAHLEGCTACSTLLTMHGDLHAQASAADDPGEAAFRQVRENVLWHISNRKPAAHRRRGKTPPTWIVPALVAAMITIGFLGFWTGRFFSTSSGDPSRHLRMQIHREARANLQFEDAENTPYSYANIAFSPLDQDRVRLSFDVATHVDMVGHKQDPLVKELLVQSLLNPNPVSSRLKAIGMAREVMEPKVKQALIFSILNDENLAVRMKAMSLLADFRDEEGVREAFLTVLRQEEAVSLRMLALDCLAGNAANLPVLEELRQNWQRPEDIPLLMRVRSDERP